MIKIEKILFFGRKCLRK